MSPRDFDRFMADVRNGTNFKLARLSHAHYRAWFSAVLPIAALNKVRGAFMVNGEPATAEDMRIVSPALALSECRSALEVFRLCGMLEHDDELGGEWVHDFEEWNPEPKRSASNAERQKRYRDRQKASRHATRNVTPNAPETSRNTPEVEEEEKTPPTPLGGNVTEEDQPERGKVVTFRKRRVPPDRLTTAEQALASFNRHAGMDVGAYRSDGRPSDALTRILGAITDKPEKLTGEYCDRLVRDTLRRRWWGEGPPSVGVVFGPNVLDRNMAALDGAAQSMPKTSLQLAQELRGGAA